MAHNETCLDYTIKPFTICLGVHKSNKGVNAVIERVLLG